MFGFIQAVTVGLALLLTVVMHFINKWMEEEKEKDGDFPYIRYLSNPMCYATGVAMASPKRRSFKRYTGRQIDDTDDGETHNIGSMHWNSPRRYHPNMAGTNTSRH